MGDWKRMFELAGVQTKKEQALGNKSTDTRKARPSL
jgi:hypothetical protein